MASYEESTGGTQQSSGSSFQSGSGSSQQQATSQQQAQGTSQQQGQTVAQSTTQSFLPAYSTTPILEEIANFSRQAAPLVYQWGMDQYDRNQGNIDALMRDALSYASPQRVALDMGQAEAGVQQGAEQARQSAIRDLQSYGIDPSSGRYAALDQANRVQAAASAAGAGNQQRMADFAQGNTMRNQAQSMALQNNQLGYGASTAMNQLLGTASQLKYPPLGTVGQSTNQSTSSGSSQNTSSGSSQSTGSSQNVSSGGSSQSGSSTPSHSTKQSGSDGSSGSGSRSGTGTGTGSGYLNPSGDVGNTYYDPYNTSGNGGYNDAYGPGGYDGVYQDYGGAPADTLGGAYYGDSGAGSDFSGGFDVGFGSDGFYAGGPVGYQDGGDVDEDDFDEDDMGGYSDSDADDATTGGFVSHDLSPSGGQETDDVDARLNAGEFVIPKDVAAWKGQEFFYKLMAQARKMRAMAGNENGDSNAGFDPGGGGNDQPPFLAGMQ